MSFKSFWNLVCGLLQGRLPHLLSSQVFPRSFLIVFEFRVYQRIRLVLFCLFCFYFPFHTRIILENCYNTWKLLQEGMVEFIGLVKVKVKKGTNLAIRDMLSSDPYVVLALGKQVSGICLFLFKFSHFISQNPWLRQVHIMMYIFVDHWHQVEIFSF